MYNIYKNVLYVFADRAQQPQTLLFSATCPPWVQKTSRKYMRPDMTEHVDTIGSSFNKTATTVQHLAIRCNWQERDVCIGKSIYIFYFFIFELPKNGCSWRLV